MTDGSTTWTYTYNADGLRTKRTNGTTTYSYVYNGSSLTQMTVGSDTLYFAYDGSSPMSVTYNGTNYYYATNLQGDVIAILNSSGTAVVQYTYDAWGNILTTTGSMASTLGAVNPLTYRGYVYDRETGLYYLQSRYYNPEVGRFINADAFAATGQGFIGNNMFAYCGNNPVCRIDPCGASWWGNFWDGVRDWLEDEKKKRKNERGTVAVGYSGSISAGLSGAVGIGVTADKQGNVGLMLFVNYGGGMPSASVNGFITATNAPNIYKTTGMGTELGGTISAGPISVGGEYVMLIDEEAGETYHGGTYLGGMSPPKLPIPAELHGGVGQTWIPISINIFDVGIAIVDVISP